MNRGEEAWRCSVVRMEREKITDDCGMVNFVEEVLRFLFYLTKRKLKTYLCILRD